MHHRLNKTLCVGLIVVAMLVAGCSVRAQGTSTAQTSVSPTAKPALTWQKRALPSNAVGWAISPVTGRDGWACVPRQSGGFAILATHDEAATWAQVGSVTLATPEPAGLCDLVADQGVSTALAAVISWGSGEAGTLRSIGLISTDSGAHWRKLAGEIVVGKMETAAGTTYAILYDTTTPALDEGSMQLAISTDGLRTWHTTRPPRLDPNDSFFDFHLGSSAGEIVAATYQNTLWQSADNGVSWSRIATPDQQITLSAWLPQARQWMLCGSDATSATPTCSVDTGKTWQQ